VKAFYSDTFVLPIPDHHRFPMTKYRLLRELLIDQGVLAADDLHVPDPISWDDLRLVHDPAYVEAVACGALPPEAQRRIGFPWSEMMVERSRRSVGATLAAAREVLRPRSDVARGFPPSLKLRRTAEALAEAGQPRDRGPAASAPEALQRATPKLAEPSDERRRERAALQVSANLAGGTHHAFRDRGEGYCVFNDVAVAATVLLREGAIARAAIVDCDVHQGNGTAAIFRDEPAVFTFSLHGAHNFPFRKETSDLDVTFEDGAGDDEYLAALADHLPRVLDAHRPDLVFFLAGADPYAGDRLGRLKLTIDGLRARDRLVFDACRVRALPVAVAMSGGYAFDVNAIVSIHANTIREALRIW
jgi:acetoin utilization deacetylase AcuC-like enzyme